MNQENTIPEEEGVYVISVASQLSGLHPQTLRQYDRLGIVSPNRTIQVHATEFFRPPNFYSNPPNPVMAGDVQSP